MLQLILKLLGVPTESVARLVQVSPGAHPVLAPAWLILAAAALAAGVIWLYLHSGEHLPSRRKLFLAILRISALSLLLGLFLRPILVLTLEGSVRRTLLLLLDASASMKIEDARSEADLQRAAIAQNHIDPTHGLDQPPPAQVDARLSHASRLDLLKAALKNPRLELLNRLSRDYDIRVYQFGREKELVELSAQGGAKQPSDTTPASNWIDRLHAVSSATAGGDAIRELLSRTRGQPLAGIVMATDGQNNSGSQPLQAAEIARQEGVPLYLYGLGITTPKDLIVANVFAPEVVFAEDELPLTVRVRSEGLAGQAAILKVQLGDQAVEQPITLVDGEQRIAVKLATKKIAPQKQIELNLKASIDPRDEEVVKDNNAASQHVRIIDGRIRVLYVEQSPRWEFRYLQAMLLRDRRIDLKCVLLEGDPAIATDKSPYLPRFPEKKEDLLANDLVILGDVDPRAFSASQLDALSEFVSKFGGGLLMIAGKRFSPQAYRRNVLEKLLPVEVDVEGARAVPRIAGDEIADKPVKLDLTPAGQEAPMLRLADKQAESLTRWARLPPVYWTARLARTKPGAQSLVVDADPAKGSRFGKMPIVVLQQYGLGQVLFVGTDNTWRWRKNSGDEIYATFWGQLVQRLSITHLLGAAKRTQLSTDRQDYVQFDRVLIDARLYTETYEPVLADQIRGFYQLAGAPPQELTLRPLPDTPGFYRGEFVAPSAGVYQFWIDRDEQTKLSFAVAEPKIELAETAMNERLLKQMAQISGGAFYREEDLFRLPDQIQLKSERIRSTLEVDLWSSPLYFLLLLLVLTAEWILRKLSHLK